MESAKIIGQRRGRHNPKRIRRITPAVAAVSAALAAASGASAANGTWNSLTSGLWSDTTKWSGGTVADGATSIADFSTLNLGADTVVSLDSSRTIGQLKFADITTPFFNWTLNNNGNAANVLTLDNGASQPIITVGTGTNATQIATMSGVIAGTNGFIKTGSSALLLTGSNTFTGQVTLNSTTNNTGADLYLGSSNALGAATNTLFIDPGGVNNTRVRLNDGVNIANPITLHTVRAPAQNGILQTNGLVNATISGAITIDSMVASGGIFSGPVEATANHFLTISGPITLSSQYTNNPLHPEWMNNANNNGVVLRAGNIILSGGGSYFRFEVRDGLVRLGATNGTATNAYVDMGVNNGNPAGINATIDLFGFNQQLVGLENLAKNGTVTNSVDAASILTLTPGISAGQPTPPNLVFAGSVMSDAQATLASSLLSVVVNGSPTGMQTFNNPGSSYHGSTTLNGGVLAVNTLANGGANSSIGASSNAATNLVFGGGTLRYTGGSVSTDRNFTTNAATTGTIDVSAAGTILTMTSAGTGGGGLTKAGAGTLQLTGTHTYTGNTTISGGTLRVDGSLAAASNVSIASGATLSGAGTVGGAVTSASGGIIAPAGAGTAGTITLGALTLNNGAQVNVEFDASNDQVTVANSGGLTLSGGNVFLYNTGTTTAFASNGTYTLFNINGGFAGSVDNLTVSNPVAGKFYNITGSASAINLTIGDATTIAWTNGNNSDLWTDAGNWAGGVIPNAVGQTANFDGGANGSGSVNMNGSKTVSGLIFTDGGVGMSYNISGSGALTMDNGSGAGAITVSSGAHTLDVPVVLNGAVSVMTATGGDSLTVSRNISGAFPVTITGPGTVNLTGTNSFTTLSLNGGTLNVGNGGAGGTLGSGAVTLVDGAILNFNTTSTYNFGQNISGAGTLNQIGSGTTTVGAASVTAVNVSNGTLVASSINQSNGVVVSGGGSLTVGGAISGGGKLTVITGGAVSLGGANTYGGGTQIDAGTVTLGPAGTLPNNSALAVNGGTLDLNGRNISIGNILDTGSSGGVITNNGAGGTTSTVSFTGNAADYHMFAALNDGASGGKVALVSTIINVNNGTFALGLHSAGTYSGGTTITRQSIDAYATNALGTGPVVLQYNPSSTNVTHLGVAGGITLPNDITIAVPNAGAGNGAIAFLPVTFGSATLTGAITVQADNATGGTFSGPTNPGDFLNINGPVTATGPTTAISVRAGNVAFGGGGSYPQLDIFANAALNAPNGIATNAVLNPNADGSLDILGNDQTVAGVIGAGAIRNTSGSPATLTVNAASSYSYAGAISGNLNLTKSGVGVQTLTESNSYTGATTASGGRLVLGKSLTTSSSVSAQSAAVIELANDGSHNQIINTGAVSIAAAAKIDLKDNKLITTTAPGSTTNFIYNGLQGEVQRTYNFQSWDQPGLTTSEPAATTGLTTIGITTGAARGGLGPTDTDLFAGQTITGASTLAMYTYAGDANLDGLIDGGDYGIIDNNVQIPGADSYYNGDFNYDGVIDGGDYGIIDNNIQAQGAPFPVSGTAAAALSGVTAVPEPSACAVVILAATAMFGRRRRRRVR